MPAGLPEASRSKWICPAAAPVPGDGEVYFGFDGTYRSRFSSNPSRSACTDIAGYALASFRLGFRTDDGGWDISAWLRNAFDKHLLRGACDPAGSTGLLVGQPADPRTWGVTGRASF